MTEIGAKVAGVLNATTVVVNRGSEDGVTVGSSVRFFHHVEVKDPDTREPIGLVTVPKLTMEVREVGEKIAIAVTPQPTWSTSVVSGVSFLPSGGKRTQVTPIGSHYLAGTAADEPIPIRVGEDVKITINEEEQQKQQDSET